VDWINLTHDRDEIRAVVNTVMNLQVRELHSYVLLRSEWWQFLIDVSVQTIGSVFSGQESNYKLPLLPA